MTLPNLMPITPPESTKTSRRSLSPRDSAAGHSSDHECLRLIGSTKFQPLGDVKTVLVTGGAGFIGSWLTRHLTIRYPEYNIICFDKLDKVSSLANIHCLEAFPNFKFVQGNLTDEAALSKLFAEHDIECVLHFAACSHVQDSFEDPSSFTLNNVVATQRLLDAVRQHGNGRIQRFLHISTDEVYGDAMDEFVDESKQLMPTNPYSASKAAAEMYVWAYAKSFNIPAMMVRSNNVYGPCQFPEKIIPRFYTLLSKEQPVTIQGTGLNVRRYLYAADAANAFDTVLHKGAVGEAYNLNSEYGVTNLEVAVRMLELFGYSPQKDFRSRLTWIADRPFNDTDYRVDGSKLGALGWRQHVSFPAGLQFTVEWYHKNMHLWWPQEARTSDLASSVAT